MSRLDCETNPKGRLCDRAFWHLRSGCRSSVHRGCAQYVSLSSVGNVGCLARLSRTSCWLSSIAVAVTEGERGGIIVINIVCVTENSFSSLPHLSSPTGSSQHAKNERYLFKRHPAPSGLPSSSASPTTVSSISRTGTLRSPQTRTSTGTASTSINYSGSHMWFHQRPQRHIWDRESSLSSRSTARGSLPTSSRIPSRGQRETPSPWRVGWTCTTKTWTPGKSRICSSCSSDNATG